MATASSTTRNLKLRLTPGLTTDALYNLNRIDLAVGQSVYQALTGVTYLRSVGDLVIEPNSADIGGLGSGGTLTIGTPTHTIDLLQIFATSVLVGTDEVVLRTATQTVTNKTFTGSTISGANNTLSAIAYGSLVLSNSIVNADIAATAAIAYSKLALSNSLVNSDIAPTAAIAYSKLALSDSITTADLASTTKKTLSGTANRLSVTNGAQATLANVTLDVAPALLPSPLVADVGSVLTATGVNTASWQPAGIASDNFVKISATDTTTNYLGVKITAGNGIALTKLNPGANESLVISNTGIAPPDYTHTFVFGDWTGPVSGYYSLAITHNLNAALVEVDVWDAGVNRIMVDWTRTSNNIVTLSVPAVPNLRFGGSIWIKTT